MKRFGRVLEGLPKGSRWVLVCAVLLLGIGLGLDLARYWRVPRGAAVDVSGMKGPLFNRDERLLDYDGLLDLLAPPAGQDGLDLLLAEMLEDPALARQWGELVKAKPKVSDTVRLRQMKGKPGFEELLGKVRKKPAFEKEVRQALERAAIARLQAPAGGAGNWSGAAGVVVPKPSKDGDRVLVRPEEGDLRAAPAATRGRTSTRGRGGQRGRPMAFARLSPQTAGRLVQGLADGESFGRSCELAGVGTQCDNLQEECSRDSACRDLLRGGIASPKGSGTTSTVPLAPVPETGGGKDIPGGPKGTTGGSGGGSSTTGGSSGSTGGTTGGTTEDSTGGPPPEEMIWEFITPAISETISGNYVIRGNASDDVIRVEILIDLQRAGTAAKVGGKEWAYTLDVSKYSGHMNLSALLFNDAGRVERYTIPAWAPE